MEKTMMRTSPSKNQHNRKKNSNLATAHYNTRTISKIQATLKQKSEASIVSEEKQKDRELYMYLLEAPTQLLDADFRNKQSIINQRVHSHSKQGNHKYSHSKTPLLFDDQPYFSINPPKKSEKAKINLMIGREGAQYRRVRKIAEQSLRQDHTEPSGLHVKGLKGSKIEIDSRRTHAKVSLQDNSKVRRTSAETFFRKNLKAQDRIELNKNEINVLCRGKQIQF